MAAKTQAGGAEGSAGEWRPSLVSQSYVNRPEVEESNTLIGLHKAAACVSVYVCA